LKHRPALWQRLPLKAGGVQTGTVQMLPAGNGRRANKQRECRRCQGDLFDYEFHFMLPQGIACATNMAISQRE
jgi:hypothetical protein